MTTTTKEQQYVNFITANKKFHAGLVDVLEECHGVDITNVNLNRYAPATCVADNKQYTLLVDCGKVPRLKEYDNKESYQITVTLERDDEVSRIFHVTMDPVLDERLEETRQHLLPNIS